MITSRRSLFRSLSRLTTAKEESFKPFLPYKKENADLSVCLSCSLPCKNACPENIILSREGELPFLDFSHRGCTFCSECASVCPHDILSLDSIPRIEGHLYLDITLCLAWNKTLCYSCHDACNEKAIQFTGLFHPEITLTQCTQCGFCISPCPVQALRLKG